MILSPCPAIPCPITNTAHRSTTKRRQILAIPVRGRMLAGSMLRFILFCGVSGLTGFASLQTP
jgi:hypothetical protein